MKSFNKKYNLLVNFISKIIALTAITFYSLTHIAEAGILTDDQWLSSACGNRPTAPIINASTEDTFNESITAANTYRQKIKPYLDCIVEEANKDIQLINKHAKNEQLAIQEENTKITEDVQVGNEKFK